MPLGTSARPVCERRRGAATLRARAWYAEALLRRAASDRKGAQTAARAGLRILDEFAAALGATDVRAHVASHRIDLAELGLRIAIDARSGPGAFAWAERGRASHLSHAPASPPDDPRLADSLAELRLVTHDIEEGRSCRQRCGRLTTTAGHVGATDPRPSAAAGGFPWRNGEGSDDERTGRRTRRRRCPRVCGHRRSPACDQLRRRPLSPARVGPAGRSSPDGGAAAVRVAPYGEAQRVKGEPIRGLDLAEGNREPIERADGHACDRDRGSRPRHHPRRAHCNGCRGRFCRLARAARLPSRHRRRYGTARWSGSSREGTSWWRPDRPYRARGRRRRPSRDGTG